MRQVKIPRKAHEKNKKAFEDYVERKLDELMEDYSKDSAYMAYLSCLKVNPRTKRRKSIVICKVKELAQIVKSVVAVKEKYGTIDWKPLEDDLKKLFNYSYRFVCGNNSRKWDTGQYIKSMIDSGVGYCPYCNSVFRSRTWEKLERIWDTAEQRSHRARSLQVAFLLSETTLHQQVTVAVNSAPSEESSLSFTSSLSCEPRRPRRLP